MLQIPISKFVELQEQSLEYRERLSTENSSVDQAGTNLLTLTYLSSCY